MAEKTDLDSIHTQNEEHNKTHSSNLHPHSLNAENNQSKTDVQYKDAEDAVSSNMNRISQSAENNEHGNGTILQNAEYNRSMSMDHGGYQQRRSIIQKSLSVPGDPQNDQQTIKDTCNEESISKNRQENKQIPLDSTENTAKFEGTEERKTEFNHQSPVYRLLAPTCEGILERVLLLGELITSNRVDPVLDVYDEMANIIAATERNARLKEGSDGQRLLDLTTAARSNLNVDLHNLDMELQRQFGLHSVEVTGDGACAFRATLISGMRKPDMYHSELREKAIHQVSSDTPYYSTVLRPGDKVSRTELDDWIQSMYDPNTYGDEMANIAVADRYHVQLVIFRAGELLTVVNPRDGNVEHTAFLVNVGTHYKALVPWHELDQARQNSERLCK